MRQSNSLRWAAIIAIGIVGGWQLWTLLPMYAAAPASPTAEMIVMPTASRPLSTAATVPLTDTPIPTRATVVRTTLIATGDVLLGRMVRTQSEAKGGATWPFEQTRDLLSSGDITLINLEVPITTPCPRSTVGLIFCAPPEMVEGLTYAGVDVANVANNHTLDKGIEGYATTLDALTEAGIQPSDADHVVIIDQEGITFGFIGFNRIQQYPDTPILSTDEITQRIRAANAQVDVLIVSIHWGVEFRTRHNRYQTELALLAIDAGADVIVGTHPHVIQPPGEYQGKLILYSLGNFVFDDMSGWGPRQGQVAVLHFEDTRLIDYELVPITIYEYGQPRVDEGR
jgi:poly-gamma-glutamate capsule biosynthesis protein CapA/YwtB (metallophosphatase superfamily)